FKAKTLSLANSELESACFNSWSPLRTNSWPPLTKWPPQTTETNKSSLAVENLNAIVETQACSSGFQTTSTFSDREVASLPSEIIAVDVATSSSSHLLPPPISIPTPLPSSTPAYPFPPPYLPSLTSTSPSPSPLTSSPSLSSPPPTQPSPSINLTVNNRINDDNYEHLKSKRRRPKKKSP
ncbi:uncharacterized protein, partial [Halyomorpha halys]|uniref:uncharacterized protein n=1 Tax=Halyomorpha halys TaxID=286706 RepID=UPI000D0C8937